VGFRVLAEALGRGYKVRAVIRNAAQAEQIKATKSVGSHLGQLDFVVVPDLGRSGAFDGVLDNAVAVIHVASPLPSHVSPLSIFDDVLMAKADFSDRGIQARPHRSGGQRYGRSS
jgi:uncharacterized protein YbjT (DUF2867 family)